MRFALWGDVWGLQASPRLKKPSRRSASRDHSANTGTYGNVTPTLSELLTWHEMRLPVSQLSVSVCAQVSRPSQEQGLALPVMDRIFKNKQHQQATPPQPKTSNTA